MEFLNDLKISVIITAYKRRELLIHAIESVLLNGIDPSLFEIILITNYKVDIGNLSPEYQISSTVIEGTIGEYLYTGIQMAKNDIIVFLDDDDEFELGKIDRVLSLFENDDELVYYHNSWEYIDDAGKPINYSRMVESRFRTHGSNPIMFSSTDGIEKLSLALKQNADFNLSCIAVRKKNLEIYGELLKNIEGSTDGFFFWVSVISGEGLFIDPEKLTKYRVHNQNVTKSANLEDRAREVGRQVKTYGLLLAFLDKNNDLFQNVPIITEWISMIKLEYEIIQLFFLQRKRKTIANNAKKLIKYDRKVKNVLKHRLIFLSLSYLLIPTFAVLIYKNLSK